MITVLTEVTESHLRKINELRDNVSRQENSVIKACDYALSEINASYILLIEEESLEGYATLAPECYFSPADEIHLNLFVNPSNQRNGIGKKLIQKAKELASTIQGIEKVTIMVIKRRPDLKPYYESKGFSVVKESSYCWNMECNISNFT